MLTTVGSHTALAAPDAPSDEALAAAEQAGVDPLDLQGAANTTGLDPFRYLYATGELAAPSPAIPAWTVWDRLAQCESTGRWHVATGNGYYGGLQEDMRFWSNYGGQAYASRPDLASREQQITVAERGLKVQSWKAWPRCSVQLGLR
jgi:hypothetical protein